MPNSDQRTLEAMGHLYCRAHHAATNRDSTGLCADCRNVVETTLQRTRACPHGHHHNCEDCATKCHSEECAKQIRALMAYSAPRMLLKHPLMTLRYLSRKLNAPKHEAKIQ